MPWMLVCGFAVHTAHLSYKRPYSSYEICWEDAPGQYEAQVPTLLSAPPARLALGGPTLSVKHGQVNSQPASI
ncbi:hypothetical protein B0J15DRAFT_484798 [Fusarium solani]|uniref:Uncharacterized protein n=1 Tax=Fusarium solani TaxID=169388 RepID=A0A9P9KYS6_FUSSL|nr:uncharacterized protein B0J15DRAFT_484798 [Fusarium solani]KAH7271365.1 hypothetical protein B0J15DRAFT_484798 [Fusarium solani]